MSDVTFTNALAELQDAIEIARDELQARITDIVGPDTDDIFVEGEDGKTRIDGAELGALLNHLAAADDEASEAFTDFDWGITRVMRDFRKTLSNLTEKAVP
jgi:hypothetical protein